MKITEVNDILKDIRSLKIKLVKAQDFESSCTLRDIEKKYLDKEVSDG